MSPTRPEPKTQASPALFLGAPLEYVPAAGLRWLIVAHPAAAVQTAGVEKALAALVPATRVTAFRDFSGIDVRHLTEAVIAGYDYATLYLVRVETTQPVRSRFLERLLYEPEVSTPQPGLYRASGVIAETPQTYVELKNHLVAVAVGDRTPALAVEGYARRKLKRSPVAMRSAALRSLRDWSSDAHVRGYALGPFKPNLARGAHGLLRSADAVAIAAWLTQSNMRVVLSVAGAYRNEALPLLEQSFNDLQQSHLGSLLGLDDPANPPSYRRLPERLQLEIVLRLPPLIAGLHAAVSDEVASILQLRSPTGNVGSGSEKPDTENAGSPLPSRGD